MPIMFHLNLHTSKADEFDEKADMFLISAFNRLPADCTAENLPKRGYRLWLIKITEEVNAKALRMYDILDVLLRLQSMRKAGRLNNRSAKTKDTIGDTIEGIEDLVSEESANDADARPDDGVKGDNSHHVQVSG